MNSAPVGVGDGVRDDVGVHVAGEVAEFPWDLMAGAKGVQLAEAGLRSWRERRWIDLPALEA